jgi:hypothetical protein
LNITSMLVVGNQSRGHTPSSSFLPRLPGALAVPARVSPIAEVPDPVSASSADITPTGKQ